MRAVGGDEADALAAVMGAAASQGNDQIAALGLIHLVAFMHIVVGGVGLCAVLDHRHHVAFGPHNLGDAIGDTGGRDALVRTDKGFYAAERLDLVADLPVRADAIKVTVGM
jgi:hypothetical protein